MRRFLELVGATYGGVLLASLGILASGQQPDWRTSLLIGLAVAVTAWAVERIYTRQA